MYKMFWPVKVQPYLSKRPLAPSLSITRRYSADEMRFRIYPHRFPLAMLNIMNYGKRFLKVEEFEDLTTHNLVRIESDGLIDPYLLEPGGGS